MKPQKLAIIFLYAITTLVFMKLARAGDPVHFTPVQDTGAPQAVIIQNATMNGAPLQAGDEVGIFDDSLCVGAASYDGEYPFTITVWEEVTIPGGGKKSGGRPGYPMRFVLWQQSTDFEGLGTPTYESGSTGVFGEALTVLTLLEGLNHFIYTANTGNNSTVIIPDNIEPNIAGTPLEFGDEIGVFTPSGLCVGAVVWTLGDAEVKVWGDDDQNSEPEINGILTGEVMYFRLWDVNVNLGYYTEIGYSSGPETYIQNSISTLNKLNGVPPPYPVEMTSFEVIKQENNILLSWQTASESNNYGFEIQRLLGNDWRKIDFVRGNGTTTEPRRYEFIDYSINIPPGVNELSYRLKQIDTDGSYEYSKIINVALSSLPGNTKLSQNYPNPFNPTTNIRFALPEADLVKLGIYNLLGKEIETLVNRVLPAGNHLAEWNAHNRPSGIYFYRLKTDKFEKTMKFILQK
ncbi:MAG: T9SS type A sorting domain-containing protein [Methanosarcinaceae archaeon]